MTKHVQLLEKASPPSSPPSRPVLSFPPLSFLHISPSLYTISFLFFFFSMKGGFSVSSFFKASNIILLSLPQVMIMITILNYGDVSGTVLRHLNRPSMLTSNL